MLKGPRLEGHGRLTLRSEGERLIHRRKGVSIGIRPSRA